jgi:hypothetical protein
MMMTGQGGGARVRSAGDGARLGRQSAGHGPGVERETRARAACAGTARRVQGHRAVRCGARVRMGGEQVL